MTDIFFSLSKNLATIISQQLSLFFLIIFCNLFLMHMVLQPYLFMGVLCHLRHSIHSNVLWHIVIHQHLTWSNFLLYWHFHFHILDCLFSLSFPYFPYFHILLHCLFSLLNNHLFIVFFNLIFWGAFPRDGFTCFIYAIVYFLSIAEYFVTKISPEVSLLFLYKFFTPIFQCQCLVICHTQRPIFSWGFW